MPRLIDADPLLERTTELEAVALEQVAKCGPLSDIHPGEWHKWAAILQERTAFKHDLMDAPTVDAVEVVRCKDCKHYWKNNPSDDAPLCLASPKDDAFCSEGKRREDERK